MSYCESDGPLSAEQSLLLDNQVCFPLYSASNAVIRTYRPLLDTLELTYSQYLVMMVLWQNDGVKCKDVGSAASRLRTLTPLLKRLESKGFVVRGAANRMNAFDVEAHRGGC